MTDEVRRSLAALQRRLDGAVAIVSGRPLADIDALCGRDLAGLAAAGLHGLEWRSSEGRVETAACAHPRMAAALERALLRVQGLDGVLVENKRAALALHFRGAPDAAAQVRTIAGELADLAGPEFRLQAGDHVIELRPRGRNKGDAIGQWMRDPPFAGRRPWMVGDDLTDEHAFDFVNRRHGISVVVGARRPTAARFSLRDPAATRAWLAAAASSEHR